LPLQWGVLLSPSVAPVILTSMICASEPNDGRASKGPPSGHCPCVAQDFVGPDESDGPSEVQQCDMADNCWRKRVPAAEREGNQKQAAFVYTECHDEGRTDSDDRILNP
jgi:hypothetical protein